MMMKSLCSPALLAAALVGPAYAADSGQCATPEAMTAMLKAEDEHSIITAHRMTPDRKLVGMIVTMSSDRSVGYVLDSDRKLGEKAGQFCVYQRLADLRLFDARKPGLAPGVLLKASDADGEKQCDEWAASGKLARGNCVPLNVALRSLEKKNKRVLLHALVVEKRDDGRYFGRGVLATIAGELGGSVSDAQSLKAASLSFSALTNGASYIGRDLVSPEYTPYALQALVR